MYLSIHFIVKYSQKITLKSKTIFLRKVLRIESAQLGLPDYIDQSGIGVFYSYLSFIRYTRSLKNTTIYCKIFNNDL